MTIWHFYIETEDRSDGRIDRQIRSDRKTKTDRNYGGQTRNVIVRWRSRDILLDERHDED